MCFLCRSHISLKPVVLFVNSKKDTKFKISSCWHSAFTISLKEMCTFIVCQEIPHYAPTSKECNGLPWKVWGFSVVHILLFCFQMYPQIWNHASTVTGNWKMFPWTHSCKLSRTCEENMFGLQLLRGGWCESITKSHNLCGFCAAVVLVYIFPMDPVEVVQLQP
jgi:hypothetical protein